MMKRHNKHTSGITVYLASPVTQQQAEHVCDMPVLLSFACYAKTLDRYQQTFSRILIDSGAFSEFSSSKKIDLGAYADWSERWNGHADAVAGLDDISGDWKRSLANYEKFPRGFPTFHESDPPELLDDLVAMATERDGWIGLGLLPPRNGKERWIRAACDRIPDHLHVHGWAGRAYTNVRRLDSVDSTNWWRDGMAIRQQLPWMTYGECLSIVVKRYQRETRMINGENSGTPLFDLLENP
jgi:hypothetical protein